MKIAVFHNLLSGGAKRTLHEVTRRLSGRHHLDVYTLSCANHDFADLRPFVANYQVFQFEPGRLLASPFGRINQAIRLADLLRLRPLAKSIAMAIENKGYDAVFVHPCRFENSPSVLRHLDRTPSVYYCQEPLRLLYETMPVRPYNRRESSRNKLLDRIDPLPGIYHRVLKDTDRQNIRRAKVVLVNSEFIRGALSSIYQVDARVSYLGVDAQLFRPLPIDKTSMLLSVGSLTPLKGFDFLIRSVAEIPENRRPALWVVSNFENPPERVYLESLACELGVSLNLLGNVSEETLVRLYNQACVTAYASVREPFGLVPLESMACGTPVVAVREGGVQESVVPGQVGLLVERDTREFANGLEQLLADPALASEYGHNGRELVLRKWTWSDAVTTLEAHLSAAMNARLN